MPPEALITREAARFLAGARLAVVATINRDGTPHQAVVWYLFDGSRLTVNSAVGRRWPSNLVRDQRIEITVPGRTGYVKVSGRVDVDADPERSQADIAAMARRYHAKNPAHAEELIKSRFEPQQRVSFRLNPTQIHDHLDGD